MPPRTRSAVLALLLAPLAALWLVPSAAQAAPRTPDPERVVVRTHRTTPTARAGAGADPGAKAPASIDSDVYAYVVSPSSRTYFVLAGHLRLTLKGSSTTRYVGTFTDHSGQKTTKAGADLSKPDAPTVSLKARNGSFTFRADAYFGGDSFGATGTRTPKKIGFKAKDLHLVATKHSLRTATYQVVLAERVGPVAKPYEHTGSMTLAYDANNRVSGGQVTVTNAKGKNVTTAVTSSGYLSPGSYFYTVVTVDKTTIGISGTFTGTSFGGNGFSGSGSKTTQWVVSGTA